MKTPSLLVASLLATFMAILSGTNASAAEGFKLMALFVDGQGHGIVQFNDKAAQDAGIYAWDYLWFDGQTIQVLESSGSGMGSYLFSDSRFGEDGSVALKIIDQETVFNPAAAVEYTCAKAGEAGKDFRFTLAPEAAKAALQARIDAGTVKIASIPVTRGIEWVLTETLADASEQYYVIDYQRSGPRGVPSSGSQVYVGPKGAPKKVEIIDQIMAMCGVDHRYLLPEATEIHIFRPAATGCQSEAPIEATITRSGSSPQALKIVAGRMLEAKGDARDLGLDPKVFGEAASMPTPCDLAL